MITARDNFKKICISRFTIFARILVFGLQKNTRQLYNGFSYHVVLLQYQNFTKRNAAQSIFRKFRIYSFSWNLDFRTLEKDLTIFQLQRILHGIMIISKVLIMTTATTIYRKICNVRNLAFYNICQNLGFQLLEKDWVTL